jgi:glutamate N-acetyltransferase/amino-acid N-acetyltransferase
MMKSLFACGALPRGFESAGISARLKKSGRKDLALFYSEVPCAVSVLFTGNKIKAAPLLVSRAHLKKGKIQAIIVNSGNANCMTGAQGVKDAEAMTKLVAKELLLKNDQVLVSSTGIIGRPMPMEKIKTSVPHLVKSLSRKGLLDAAHAILTTDTFPKGVSKRLDIGGREVVISGIAKGAGMVAPKLKSATMLVFVFTDALIAKASLDKLTKETVGETFNAITIDGCMSTNDMVLVMANGKAKNSSIQPGSREAVVFGSVLKEVCLKLAKMVVEDAEGATKFIEIRVRGAKSGLEAKRLAFSVANSNLFKCAMFGSDPNWGRIAAALGSVPSGLSWERLDIYLNKKPVFKSGKPVFVKDNRFLKGHSVEVDINLHQGKAQKTVYTSDLSYGYVRINADYN